MLVPYVNSCIIISWQTMILSAKSITILVWPNRVVRSSIPISPTFYINNNVQWNVNNFSLYFQNNNLESYRLVYAPAYGPQKIAILVYLKNLQ